MQVSSTVLGCHPPLHASRFFDIIYKHRSGGDRRHNLSGKDIVCLASFAVFISTCIQAAPQPQQPSAAPTPTAERALIDKYCVTCHSDKLKTGGISLQSVDMTNIPAGAETWEKVIHKLSLGAMPPQGMPRPDQTSINSLVSWLTTSLDRAAATNPSRRARRCRCSKSSELPTNGSRPPPGRRGEN